jgi:large subunit ribosomal protein L19
MTATRVLSPVKTDERRGLDLRAGDTVRVWQKITEKGKTRLQAFEGLVLARKHGSEAGATFTVRRVASGVGVEKIFPLYAPMIDKIEVLKRSKVRRAKLYHIREKAAKEIRRQMRNIRTAKVVESPVEEEEAEVEEKVINEELVVPEVEVESPVEETPAEEESSK